MIAYLVLKTNSVSKFYSIANSIANYANFVYKHCSFKRRSRVLIATDPTPSMFKLI